MKNKTVILIILDSMRKDYSDKYIWPVLRKYGFIKYDHAVSASSWTIPSHSSILTGLYPSEHEAHIGETGEEVRVKLMKKHQYLPAELKNVGNFKTILITANTLVTPFFGFDHFDEIYDISKVPFTFIEKINEKDLAKMKKVLAQAGVSGDSVVTKAVTLLKTGHISLFLKAVTAQLKSVLQYTSVLASHLLKGHSWPKDKGVSDAIEKIRSLDFSNNTFLLINLMEVHEPYKSVFFYAGYNDRILNGMVEKELWKNKYEEFAKYLSEKLDELISVILNKVNKNSLIIVTSDHGQLLGEYGLFGHGKVLVDELIRVPLYIYYPDTTNLVLSDRRHRWISCKNIYYLVKNFSENKLQSDELLYEDYVLSELYGCAKRHKNRVIRTPCHKIAVFYKDVRGVFDAKSLKWESVVAYTHITKERLKTYETEMFSIILQYLEKLKKQRLLKRSIQNVKQKLAKALKTPH